MLLMRAAHRRLLLSPSSTWTLRALQARGVHFNSSAFAPLASVQSSEYAQTHTTSDVINFGLGQPSASLLPLEMLRRAAEHRFQPEQDRALLQYGSARGYRGFREAIAEFLSGAQTGPIDPDTLMVTAGNSQAMSHAAMVLAKTNKLVFVEEPTYFLAFDIFRELGLQLSTLPVDSHGLDVDALEGRLVAGEIPAFIYTIPFFHNPTGAVMPTERCKRLVSLAQEYGFSIIADEPYNFLRFDGPSLPSLASYDDTGCVVSLGSFSKILAPGLRLGWAQSSKETIQELSAVGALRSGGGQNPVSASLVHSVLELGELEPHLDVLKATFQSRKEVLCQSLREQCPELHFVEPSGGYFVWVRLPAGVEADALLSIAQSRHGVAFTPGSRCSMGHDGSKSKDGATPNAASQFVRFSFAFYSEEEIVEGIARFCQALDETRI